MSHLHLSVMEEVIQQSIQTIQMLKHWHFVSQVAKQTAGRQQQLADQIVLLVNVWTETFDLINDQFLIK